MKSIFRIGFAFFLVSVVMSTTSCDKDDDDSGKGKKSADNPGFTNKDFLIADYNISTNGYDIFTFADLEECDKDDITRFLDYNTGIIDTGSIHCDPDESQELPFTWSLISNGTQLDMYRAGMDQVFDIKINNEEVFKIELSETYEIDNAGNTETTVLTITFNTVH